ncbi:MAG: SRPBCC family protein [Methyloceanibacter sp.]
MAIWRKVFTTEIDGAPEIIFDLVADMPNYGRWLPGSQAFGATTEVTPYPVQLGTTYLDAGPAGRRPGSVIEFDPPRRIAFRHTMELELAPFHGSSDIKIRYTLEPEGRTTRVARALDMTMQAPVFLRPFIIHAFRKENVRILAELKRYVEG